MKRHLKKFFALCIFFALITSASATFPVSEMSSLDDMRAIAVHAPSRFSPTSDWRNIEIIKETPLYDANSIVSAYCFDLRNVDTGATAYILVSAKTTDFPIIIYAPQGTSPYYTLSTDETAVFLSVGDFYVDNGDTYTSLLNDESVQKSQLTTQTVAEDSSSWLVEEYSEIRNRYINNTFSESTMRAGVEDANLTGVPNWRWTYGCVPTAMGMIISYHYGGGKENILSGLAEKMGTNSDGFTYWSRAMSGTRSYLSTRSIIPTTCEWASKNILGGPRLGATYNTKAAYRAQINAGNPVLVAVENSTATSNTYTEGFGDHGMTGVGYMFSVVDGDYIIVHTTQIEDGDWYIGLNADGFREYAWGIFEP